MSGELVKEVKEITSKITNQYAKSKEFRTVCNIIIGVASYSVLRIVYEKITRKIYGLPSGLYGIPYFGNVFQIQKQDPLWLNKLGKFGPVCTLLNGQSRTILFNDPIIANKILAGKKMTDVATSSIDPKERSFIGSNGKMWSERRRLFHNNFTLNLSTSFIEKATKKFFKKNVFNIIDNNIKNNETTDIKKLFRPVGFNIASLVCLGKELKSLDDSFYIDWANKTEVVFGKVTICFFIQYLFNGPNIISNFMSKIMAGGTFYDLFDELLQRLETFINDDTKYVDLKEYKDFKLFNDFINEYKGNKFTKKQLISDMGVALFGAMDTIWITLCMALLEFSRNIEMQEDIYNEIYQEFGNNIDNIELTIKSINKIPKLRAFLHESMRTSGTTLLTSQRQINFNGLTIKDNDNNKIYNIPKGTHIMINASYISQEPKYWVKNYDKNIHKNINMNDIHLEFWLDDNNKFSKKKNSLSFFAFGKGKRSCVGKTLAMRIMPIVLALILVKYKVRHPDGLTNFNIDKVRYGFTTGPVLKEVRFIPRN